MTIDHFRPQSLVEFKNLVDDPNNFLWTCSPCNSLKGDDWPARGHEETILDGFGYFDPFLVNRLDYFGIQEDGELLPITDPAAYMIKKLALNRIFLRFMRRKRIIVHKSLRSLEEYFGREISTIDTLARENGLSDLQRARFSEERKNMQSYLAIIDTIDEMMNGFLQVKPTAKRPG